MCLGKLKTEARSPREKLADIRKTLVKVRVGNPQQAEGVFHDLGRDLKQAAQMLRPSEK
jgi:hypothetical protein